MSPHHSLRRAGLLIPAIAAAACARAPTYMSTDGFAADREATLGWTLTWISIVVVVVVGVLILVGTFRRRARGDEIARSQPDRSIRWILIGGIIIPAIVLTFSFVYTTVTLSAVSSPDRKPTLTVEVVGHRWWWEARYLKGDSTVITANEIHIPVGQPVRVELASYDVIHSFWVPKLAGKTDVIPGQRNVTWLEADRPGVYRGQCTEYCGPQHGNMALYVVADPPDQFARWYAGQLQPAAPPKDSVSAEGESVFERQACAGCHTIRGTPAGGKVGPDLTHIASRSTIAAGTLVNTRGNLAGWIANAQGIKPGAAMPTMHLNPGDLQVLVNYLETLK